MPNLRLNRRSFLVRLGGALAPLVLPGSPIRALTGAGGATDLPAGHPDPRPGVDGSRVLPADRVPAHVSDLFDGVRAIPDVVDGIRCQCGCASIEGMYSLLSCYEGAGMAQYCEICQGEGRLAVRLHREGRTLDEIRAAVDRRFG